MFTIVSSVYTQKSYRENWLCVEDQDGEGLGVNDPMLRLNLENRKKKKKSCKMKQKAACPVTKHDSYVLSHFNLMCVPFQPHV